MGASSTSSQLAYNQRENATTTERSSVRDITTENRSSESQRDQKSTTRTSKGGGTRANVGAQISFKVMLKGVPHIGGSGC